MPLNWNNWSFVVIVKSSIRPDFVMLRLYVALNQLLLKAFSVKRMIVSSRGTLVKRDVMSYSTIILKSYLQKKILPINLQNAILYFWHKGISTKLMLWHFGDVWDAKKKFTLFFARLQNQQCESSSELCPIAKALVY